MDLIDALVERRISEAIERGEFDQGLFKGKPLPDIDTPRAPGWWAAEFVQRERARLREKRDADEASGSRSSRTCFHAAGVRTGRAAAGR